MSDLRARLADALEEHYATWGNDCGCGEAIGSQRWQVEHVADALLSLPGVVIVELPEGADIGQGWLQFTNVVAGPNDIRDETAHPPRKLNATTARRHAAALLAAADAAKQARGQADP